MDSFACFNCFINGGSQGWISEKITIFDFFVEAGQILVNNTTRAQIDVTHFRVTHLPIR
ncbi:Uncharacterised protein [Yersinia enterocolitica]|nr:Uncharacterised protein [Yersinia enterocolitica]